MELMELIKTVAHQDWKLDSNGCIRNQDGQCPLCAYVKTQNPNWNDSTSAWSGFVSIGVIPNDEEMWLIVDAADNNNVDRIQSVREELCSLLIS